MKILLDQGTPLPIRYSVAGHDIDTVHERDWTYLSDYELLQTAEREGYDVLITPDIHLSAHHSLAGQRIAVIVLTRSRWKLIRLVLGDLERSLEQACPGTYTILEVPELKPSEHFS